MLRLIDHKFPPKGLLICFHLRYLVANSSGSQRYTSQRRVVDLGSIRCFPHDSSLLNDAWRAQFRSSGKVWCTRTEYTYCQNALFCYVACIINFCVNVF